MTVTQAAKELVDGSRFSAETVHAEPGKFGRYVLASVSSMSYCTAVGLLSVHWPHYSFVTVINVAIVLTRRNKAFRVGFKDSFAHHLIARGRDIDRFEKHVDVSCLYEFTPQHATYFSQHTHIVLALRFYDSFVVKHLVLLTLVPGEELIPFPTAHLINAIYYVWDFHYIVEICLRVKVMWVPRLGDR